MIIPNNFQSHFKGIIDSTLREGMQFVNGNFSLEECCQIARYLDLIGVEYIELGNPVNLQLNTIIRSIQRCEFSHSQLLCHIRNRTLDVHTALELQIDGINLLCTADEERLRSMGKTIKSYQRELSENIRRIQDAGLEVRVSIEDYFNQPSEVSNEILSFASNLNVNRIGIADTLGNTANWHVYEQVRFLRSLTDIDIEVHMHNDLGNAVSNAVWAVLGGANWVDTTLLGIGERTGITSLSSFLMNLYAHSAERAQEYDLSLLTEAENYLASVCNIDIPFNLVTNRKNAFAHKAGIHLDAIKKFGSQTYEAFPAELIGNKRVFVTDSVVSGKLKNFV